LQKTTKSLADGLLQEFAQLQALRWTMLPAVPRPMQRSMTNNEFDLLILRSGLTQNAWS
jgi:hypothetical protein